MTRGTLHQLDISWSMNFGISNENLALRLFEICEEAIVKTSLQIVHKNLVLLPVEGFVSEEGFTFFFSLDSSHCSAHCYYDSKLLAIDLFGCGKSDLKKIIDEISSEIMKMNETMICTFYTNNDRFHERVK